MSTESDVYLSRLGRIAEQGNLVAKLAADLETLRAEAKACIPDDLRKRIKALRAELDEERDTLTGMAREAKQGRLGE